MNTVLKIAAVCLFAWSAAGARSQKQTEERSAVIVGYLRDSGCVHRFHEVVKPLPNGCLEACVRAGSPLVVLTKDDEVYHPISTEMPDVDIRQKLLPFAGKLVRIVGSVYDRGSSHSIVVEKIEEVKDDADQKAHSRQGKISSCQM